MTHGRLRQSIRFLLIATAVLAIFAPAGATAEDEAIEAELDSIRQQIDSPDASAELSETDTGAESDTGAPDDESIEQQLDAIENEVDRKTDENVGARPPQRDPGERDDTAPPTTDPAATSGNEGGISTWELYGDPILCALIAGAILGLLGVYVVARRIVFVSAALSQASALGITLGFFLVAAAGLGGLLHDLLPAVLAIVLSLVVVFALTAVGDHPSFPRDAVLGTAFVVPMALVLVLGPYIPQEMHEIQSILHGSAVVVRPGDLWAVGLAAAVILATQLFAFRAFVFASLDPLVAKTQGLPVAALDAVLFGSIALMTGLATRALGALPTFALTVLPAVGALRLEIGLGRVFAVASLLGATAGAAGYGLAYQLDWSVGASQTLVAGGLMLATRAVGALRDRSDRGRSSSNGERRTAHDSSSP